MAESEKKKKQKTPSYVLTLKLDVFQREHGILEKRFEISRKLYNAILGMGLKRFKALSERKAYRVLRRELLQINKQFHDCTDEKKLKEIEKLRKDKYKELSSMIETAGLCEYALINDMTPMYKPFDKNIDNKTAQALASRAWVSLERLIYKDAKRVNFKRFGEMDSIEGKWNASGIKYRNGFIKWNGLSIPVIVEKCDTYAQRALQDRVKYCRILRRAVRGQCKYYVQLVMEGVPPVKTCKETGKPKYPVGIGTVGIDIGTRTIAISSQDAVRLMELCPEVENMEREKRIIQRRLDRSRRAMNPQNYNADGTVKNGIMEDGKRKRLEWTYSSHYLKNRSILREIQRKQAAVRKQSHERLANFIISLGDTVLVEQMNFKALQKRSKDTTVNRKTGKINKKKRFGKSLANKAPAMLLSIVDRKLGYEGLSLSKINTQKAKASQYCHFTDTYEKKELKDRWHNGGDDKVQRDCYSAFLIMNMNSSLETIDRKKCLATYDRFKALHDIEMGNLTALKLQDSKFPSSMGI